MSLFGALDASGSGIYADQTWLTAIADNIANANDTAPTSSTVFPGEQVLVAPAAANSSDGLSGGVRVLGVAGAAPQGELRYDPDNPQADANGMVRTAAVDMGGQMVQMVQAQSSYQSNVSAFQQARDAYESALRMGD